jgi:glycosyltransferase involved in cell wall biosynthesis
MRTKLTDRDDIDPEAAQYPRPVPRLGVYTDYAYSLKDGRPHAERAFAIFIAELAHRLDRVTVIGKLDPSGRARYPLGDVEFVPLPYYPSLTHTWLAIRGMLGSLRPFWRALDELDSVWILGPHPLAFPFALIARLRRRRVILGVRQDSVAYMQSRHPGNRVRIALARAMDFGFRALARRWPTIVVGPALARQYAHSASVLDLSISLIREREIATAESVDRDYSGELVALSVGRLETEKNPLALADVIAALRRLEPGWRLAICGEGDLRPALEERVRGLGVADAVEFRGYVPHDAGLAEAYRDAHALAHVTWTEGLPQILYEAFAARLPVVATDVGGIREAVGEAALLVPPGDPQGIAEGLALIGRDADIRNELVERGLEVVRAHTLESESERAAEFIRAESGGL